MAITRKSKHEWRVLLDRKKHNDIEINDVYDWCAEQFGTGGRNKKCLWRFGWTGSDDVFYFKKEQDALFFALRWV